MNTYCVMTRNLKGNAGNIPYSTDAMRRHQCICLSLIILLPCLWHLNSIIPITVSVRSLKMGQIYIVFKDRIKVIIKHLWLIGYKQRITTLWFYAPDT